MTADSHTGKRLRIPPGPALIVVACVAAHVLYLAVAYFGQGHYGFPLDDAWIYQTYARNLAHTGQWAFVPGLPSTGSTSILWTLVLTPGYWLPLDPIAMTQIAGLLAHIGLALGAARLFADDSPRFAPTLAGLAVALEWHLVWASVSGMETILFAALVIWFWVWLRGHDPVQSGYRPLDGLALGLWGGLLMLARPEGILAAALGGLYGLILPRKVRLTDRLLWAALAGVGLALIVVPFFLFNLSVSGSIWPNTFLAKQTEYRVLWNTPYLTRLWQQAAVGFVGGQIVLLPGLALELWQRIRVRREGWAALPVLWVIAHWAVYAARLPVVYQHGRYAIPTIPILVVYGVWGLLRTIRPRSQNLAIRLGSQTWAATAALLFVLVLPVLGAPAYGRDVAYIDDQMVATARWVAANTPTDATIAAHDIGALGYFAPRRLIDLAGLVSPDVIPVMDDPDRLADFITSSGANYLIVFPQWSVTYQALVARPEFVPVWSTAQAGEGLPESPTGPLTVYRVRLIVGRSLTCCLSVSGCGNALARKIRLW